MNMKKYGLMLLAIAVCASLSGCGKDKAPDEPNPAELQTPQYSVEAPEEFKPPLDDEIHTAEDGVKVIEPSSASTEASGSASVATASSMPAIPLTPERIWQDDGVVTYNAFTLPEKAAFEDGSIGILEIAKLGLTVRVYESDDQMEDMEHGVAHFRSTSSWDGSVALSAHNNTPSGYGAYFKDLHTLEVGDAIIYKTALGEREYKVSSIKRIGDEDWGYLSRTTDNRLSLITCVNDNPSQRLLVQALQS